MDASRPGSRYAWYIVVTLTIVYIFSFVDRYIFYLLAESIKTDLGLSDSQMGVLMGPAFGVLYATLGVPLGWLADRARRTWIIGVGITVWSLATAACGLAHNFGQLLVARMTVGIGEATLSPCALPMIADSFPPEKRGRPVAFYAMALSLGAGIASLAGASIIIWSKTVDQIVVPGVGTVAPWQFAFFVVGLPGLIVAALMFSMREPPRGNEGARGDVEDASLRQALLFILRNWRAYASFVGIVCAMITISYGQSAWLPITFERTWGWAPSQYALYNGIAMLALGPATVNFSGWLSDRLAVRGFTAAPLTILFAGGLLLVPTAVVGPLMPDAFVAFGVLQLTLIGTAMVSAVAPTAMLNITPSEIRGQVTAVYFMVVSLIGSFLGPVTVGLMNDLVFGEAGVRFSVAMVAVLYGVPVLLLIRWGRKHYEARLAVQSGRG